MSIERINSRWAEVFGDDRLVMGKRFVPVDQPRRPLWRLPACLMGLCGHRPQSDEHGVWGECATCGRVIAFVDRETLRKYDDAALAKATAPKGEA